MSVCEDVIFVDFLLFSSSRETTGQAHGGRSCSHGGHASPCFFFNIRTSFYPPDTTNKSDILSDSNITSLYAGNLITFSNLKILSSIYKYPHGKTKMASVPTGTKTTALIRLLRLSLAAEVYLLACGDILSNPVLSKLMARSNVKPNCLS